MNIANLPQNVTEWPQRAKTDAHQKMMEEMARAWNEVAEAVETGRQT